MLDDAAFFAANSLERDVFVLTTSFTTYLTRPVSSGTLRSVGRVVNRNKSQFIAEAVLKSQFIAGTPRFRRKPDRTWERRLHAEQASAEWDPRIRARLASFRL